MEAGTAPRIVDSTGSTTIADLLPRAAERFAGTVAARHKRDGQWLDVTYAEVGEIVSEIGRGLLDLGLELGDRVALLARTRPEWTYVDFAVASAGGTVVPIYATNSPEECEWVAGNSQSRFIVCEDAAQVEKILAVRGNLPHLERIIVIEPGGDPADTLSLDELRERGRARPARELAGRTEQVARDHVFTIMYTSGTTGPPKGCVLTHGNYRDVLSMVEQIDVLVPGDVTYLYLPLAHSFALLIQLLAYDLGSTVAYFGGDTKQIVVELNEVRPTYLPSVPRIFEKIHALVTASAEDPAKLAAATQVGVKVRRLQAAGQPVPPELQQAFDGAEERLFKNVRQAFGGRLRQATTGAAPIAPEILEFFYACGVPVLEGYGMTETATASAVSTLEHFKFGTVGRPLPGCAVKVAGDGEILIKGPHVFQGYHKMEDASFGAIEDGWLHTGDLGELDEDGYVKITGRKKDILITSGGKNITPANLENMLKQSRWISQAVMHCDRRPYPVALITLDPEEIGPWAQQQGIEDTDPAALAQNPKVLELIQAVVDEVNSHFAQVEQVKRFFILDHDLSQETGELTPTLKVKRAVVYEKYGQQFDALYAG